ncbi:DEAD/DEAH box helicase [bacterium]|nr:DEAD/DEAH box helicase [bacterium]
MRIDEIFEADGPIGKSLPHYELRPQQVEMAKAVEEATGKERHLIVEAGTGVGKSLAYLIPFIYWTTDEDRKVVVSTYTKALQEQLFKKDIPFLRETLGIDFRFALCLGGENYLCLRRLNQVWQHGLLQTGGGSAELEKISHWKEETDTGLRLELSFEPSEKVWSLICREPDLCLGKRCPFRDNCYYAKARAIQAKAHILVVNHHLFFANLALGGKILPDYQAVVFDEAQNLEEVAASYLGLQVSNSQVKFLLDTIYNPKTEKGLISRLGEVGNKSREDLIEKVDKARKASDIFFSDILEQFGYDTMSRRMRKANLLDNLLSGPLSTLSKALKELLDTVSDEEDRQEIKGYAQRCHALGQGLENIIEQKLDDYVYWLEIIPKRRYTRTALYGSPLNVAPLLKKYVFDITRPAVLTSATLSVNKSFQFIEERLGLEESRELLLDSPFDYRNQVLLYISDDLPDPSHELEAYQEEVIARISKIVKITSGRAFVLFTSYRMLNKAYAGLQGSLNEVNLLRQGDLPRWKLLESFKKEEKAVLLGTNTFWQGIDVPGRALECVVISKLPFAVPDNPLVEARLEYLASEGKDPFISYQVPQAIIMFKQGFGRLIRHRRDLGIVAILDPRVRSRGYGRTFLNSLPPCREVRNVEELARLYRKWRG